MTCKKQLCSRNKQDRSEDLDPKTLQNETTTTKTTKNQTQLYLSASSFPGATCVVIEIFDKCQSDSGPAF